MRDVPEAPFFSMVFGVLEGLILQFKSPPPRYLHEEIRNVGCTAFLISLLLENTKTHAARIFC